MSIWDEEPLPPIEVLHLQAEEISIEVEIGELEVRLEGLRWSLAKLRAHIAERLAVA